MKDIDHFINSKLMAGKYTLKNTSIEFMNDGTIKGMDSIHSYKINLDYGDAGMQYDLIYLKTTNQNKESDFIYEISGNNLTLFDVNCIEKEEDFCVVIEKGKIKYNLTKK